MKKPILCRLGLHKWDEATFIDYGPTSSVRDWKKKCLRCGEVRKWVEVK